MGISTTAAAVVPAVRRITASGVPASSVTTPIKLSWDSVRSGAIKLATSSFVRSGPSGTGKLPVTTRLTRRNSRAPADCFSCAVAVVPERVVGGQSLTRILDQIALHCGLPQAIRTDNGKEFCAQVSMAWAHMRGVKLFLIEPGKPNQSDVLARYHPQHGWPEPRATRGFAQRKRA